MYPPRDTHERALGIVNFMNRLNVALLIYLGGGGTYRHTRSGPLEYKKCSAVLEHIL